jgi:hypothetical protein
MACVAGALLIGGAACSDDETDEAANGTEAATSTADEESTTSTEADDPTTTVEELTNDVIRSSMEEEHPDEAALVDWSIYRWVSGFGYTATIPSGSTSDQALAVCGALSEVVHGRGGVDAIEVVAVEAPAAALASHPGPDGECAPA